ncbi:MAG: heat-inducible transcriptional repressor HrcA [Acidobacteriota bacterium]
MMETNEYLSNERNREILHWVISTHIITGKPVGSRSVARHSSEGLSPATVRNIMADLEDLGYLHQPHSSAGRLPTDKAYRFYVDCLMQRRDISDKDREIIDRDLILDNSAAHFMERTSQVLSRVSNNVGIVLSPPISGVALKHIHFTKLTENRILVILVSRSGIVQNRVIHYPEGISQSELDQASRYIVENFKNRTLYEIKVLIVKMLRKEQALYDKFTQNIIRLSTRSFSDPEGENETQIYLDGTSNLIRTPEFTDINKMKLLFETIEEKNRLAALISRCIEEDTQEVQITIGAENALPGIEDCTLIASRYVIDDNTRGSLGILGPTRMEYARAIALVDYVARLFGRVLETGN